MRLAIPYRLVIPLLLALLPAAVFFRALSLVVVAMVFSVLLLLVSRVSGNRMGKVDQADGKGRKFIDSSYEIMDVDEKSNER